MRITIKDSTDPHKLRYELLQAFDASRFVVGEIEFIGPKSFKLRNIRLKSKKQYCGNHAGECPTNLFGLPERHRKGNWLEGADWVEANDLINDVCDSLQLSANIYTSVCWIRKHERRRMAYYSFYVGRFQQWNKDEPDSYYENWCGRKAPDSSFTDGTPGIYKNYYSEVG